MAPHRKTFHFSITASADQGVCHWRTLDSDGAILASGVAPSRQLAAACVIDALARNYAPYRAGPSGRAGWPIPVTGAAA